MSTPHITLQGHFSSPEFPHSVEGRSQSSLWQAAQPLWKVLAQFLCSNSNSWLHLTSLPSRKVCRSLASESVTLVKFVFTFYRSVLTSPITGCPSSLEIQAWQASVGSRWAHPAKCHSQPHKFSSLHLKHQSPGALTNTDYKQFRRPPLNNSWLIWTHTFRWSKLIWGAP